MQENNDFSRAITMEFYLDENRKLHVVYNGQDFMFQNFWKSVARAEEICEKVLNAIQFQYPAWYEDAASSSNDWKEIFIKIINSHLVEYDTTIDVFIRSNGSITINPEKEK
jgi:hypothetical protein